MFQRVYIETAAALGNLLRVRGCPQAHTAASTSERMVADGSVSASSPLAIAVAGLSPESRLKLLRVADDLVMHLRKSELPTPPAAAPSDFKFVQYSDSGGLQAVPPTPIGATAVLSPKLGVIRLDYDYPPALGDVDHEDSFEYPVEYEIVEGLTFKLCQEGDLSKHPHVIANFESAVEKLYEKGCDVIIGDCGFMFQFQHHAVTLPSRPSMMLLSPVSQLPSLISGLDPGKKVAIMTANSTTFNGMLELLAKEEADSGHASKYSISRAPRDRYIVVGCQDVPHFGDEVARGEAIVYEDAERGIVQLVQDTLRKHPEVDMFLLECTELPQFANTLRFKTGKPVYTAITLANMAMSGRQSNPRFGRQYWAGMWLEQQRGRMAMRLRREGDPAGARAAAEGMRDTELMRSIANAPLLQHASGAHALSVLSQLADL